MLAGLELEHHRRGGRLLLAGEQRLLGHHQVHTRRVDGIHLADAARELVFESALVIDLLGELGLAEAGLVEELETGASRGFAAQTHACRGEPRFLKLAARDADGAAVLELIRDLGVLELLDDGRLVVVAQARVGDRAIGAVADRADDEEQPDQSCRYGREADLLATAEAAPHTRDGLEYGLQAVHGLRSRVLAFARWRVHVVVRLADRHCWIYFRRVGRQDLAPRRTGEAKNARTRERENARTH